MTKRLERKQVLERSDLFDIDDLFHNKTPEQVIMELMTIQSKHERDILLYDKQVVFEVDRPDYDSMELHLNTYRWESDEELKKRQDAFDRRAAKARERAAKERALYEQLKFEQNQ